MLFYDFFRRSIDASSYSEIPTELSHACVCVCMYVCVFTGTRLCVCCYYDRACAVNRVSGWSFFGLAFIVSLSLLVALHSLLSSAISEMSMDGRICILGGGGGRELQTEKRARRREGRRRRGWVGCLTSIVVSN